MILRSRPARRHPTTGARTAKARVPMRTEEKRHVRSHPFLEQSRQASRPTAANATMMTSEHRPRCPRARCASRRRCPPGTSCAPWPASRPKASSGTCAPRCRAPTPARYTSTLLGLRAAEPGEQDDDHERRGDGGDPQVAGGDVLAHHAVDARHVGLHHEASDTMGRHDAAQHREHGHEHDGRPLAPMHGAPRRSSAANRRCRKACRATSPRT